VNTLSLFFTEQFQLDCQMKLVYSLGGSVLCDRTPAELEEFAQVLREIAQNHQVYIVVGGGSTAREFINKARALNAGEAFCDLIGISVTKINAMILIAALGEDAVAEPPDSYAKALGASACGKIVVMGGMQPGQTTDTVAALLTEYVHAHKLIVATSVDGVYTADPEIYPSAKKLDHLTPHEMVEISMKTELKAGSKSPIDPLATKIIERSSIFTIVAYGGEAANLKKAVEGNHGGTEIS